MTDQSREHAKAGQVYKFGEVEVIAVETKERCKGCVAAFLPDRCSEMPLCTSDNNSVVFLRVSNERV